MINCKDINVFYIYDRNPRCMIAKITVLAFLFITLIGLSQQTISWEVPVAVAAEEYGNIGPRMVLSESMDPLIMWGRNGSEDKLFVSRMVDGSFSEPISLGSEHNILINAAEGPQMGGLDNITYIAYYDLDNDSTGLYLVRTVDGGVTWSEPLPIISNSSRRNEIPSVAVDSMGNPVVAYISGAEEYWDARVDVVTSSNQGDSFSDPTTSSDHVDGEVVCNCCPIDVFSFEGYNYTLFRNNNENVRDMWLTKDGTGDYAEVVDLDQYDWLISACPASGSGSMVFNNKILSVWMSAAVESSKIYYSYTNQDEMVLIEAAALSSDQFVAPNQNFPDIAGDGDQVCVVWEQYIGGSKDIMFSYSDGSPADLIDYAQTAASGAGNQKNASVAFDGELFHLVYSDQILGQVMYTTGIVVPFVGIEESKKVKASVFPNPTLDFIRIQGHSGPLMVVDRLGRKVLEQSVGEREVVDVSGLASGYYSILTLNGKFVQSFSKVK